MNRLTKILIVCAVVLVGVYFLRDQIFSQRKSVEHSMSLDLLSGFEDKKIWDTSPEKGFSLKRSKKHVTEGKYSLEVVYPRSGWPSINTRKIPYRWNEFEYFIFDVFNPQEETLDFRIRLDDINKKRMNIKHKLMPGMNHVRIPRTQIAAKIDANNIAFVVLFLYEPGKRYKLYFDNMRLMRSDLIAGIENMGDPDEEIKKANQKPIPFRKAVPLPPKPVVKTGELKVPIARLKDVDGMRPLISSGIPFAKGQLQSIREFALFDTNGKEIPIAAKVLARWPQDQSIRSVLVQFSYTIDHIFEYVQFKWGVKRRTKDLEIVEPDWDYPQGMLLMPAKWLCDSQVIGEQVPVGSKEFKKYDEKVLNNFSKTKNREWTGNVSRDAYYSTPHVFYQLYVRTGELKYFIAARRELLNYRDTQIVQDGESRGKSTGGNKARYVYIDAMADDYLLTGDTKTLEVVGYMAAYLKEFIEPSRAYYPKSSKKFWTERLIAFPFFGIVTYYELTQDEEYLKLADEYMNNLYKTQMQWPSRGGFIHNLYAHDPEEGARQDEYGGSPFMTGLLLEAVVKYHQVTGSEKAADSIFRALDWLINEGLAQNGDTFYYLTADKYKGTKGEPDVNLTIAHAFGYGFRLSGYKNKSYFRVGQAIVKKGVSSAFLGTRKHFNQNYRSSGHYLAYTYDGFKKIRVEDEIPTIDKKKVLRNVLLFEDFEVSNGRFQMAQDVSFALDPDMFYLNGKSLRVEYPGRKKGLLTQVNVDHWVLEEYPVVSFAYLIPYGSSLGIRVKTTLQDWLCLGGSHTFRCEGASSKDYKNLISDGNWHEVQINANTAVKSLLPGMKKIDSIQFVNQSSEFNENQFWIDGFRIRR